eukprot:9597051-Ditylum_brightwellii.AAC.1
MAPFPTTPIQELVEMVQEEVDLYTGLAGATGGQVIPNKTKNNWYLMEFEWDNRCRWKLIDSKASMLINTNQGRREINRLPSSMTNRI